MKKLKCEYNINKSPNNLPIINCGKKAKYKVDIEDTETGEEYTSVFCKKHYATVLDCSNVGGGLRL